VSYTKNYNESVPYSGTVTVSYPKSDTGGSKTVSYSGSVPVGIAINVNTTPFDQSVSECKRHVDGVTTAVIATQGMQIAAKQKGASDVSKSIINGFFKMVRSELGQQMVELKSQSEACLLEMGQLSKFCISKQQQMQLDFYRISDRYTKTFEELDKELQRRILLMDERSFNLVENDYISSVGERLQSLAAVPLILSQENTEAVSHLQIARFRKQMAELVKAMQKYLEIYSNLEQDIHKILLDRSIDIPQQVCVPLILIQKELDSGIIDQAIPPHSDNQKAQSALVNMSELIERDTSAVDWEPLNQSNRKRLDDELGKVISTNFSTTDGDKNRRIAQMIDSLWQQSQPKTTHTVSAEMKGM